MFEVGPFGREEDKSGNIQNNRGSSKKNPQKGWIGMDKPLAARAIRANRFARIIRNWYLYSYGVSGRFAWITRISDSRELPDSHGSCESIRAKHATKDKPKSGNTPLRDPLLKAPRLAQRAAKGGTQKGVGHFFSVSVTFW